jgi:hypothetical protein
MSVIKKVSVCACVCVCVSVELMFTNRRASWNSVSESLPGHHYCSEFVCLVIRKALQWITLVLTKSKSKGSRPFNMRDLIHPILHSHCPTVYINDGKLLNFVEVYQI